MNCTEFQHLLNDSGGGDIMGDQGGFDAHRRACDACQVLYEAECVAEAEMLAALRKMPVPEASVGFADRVLAAAVTAHAQAAGHPRAVDKMKHHQRHGFMLGFGSAAVAGLALWAVVGLFPGALSPMDGTTGDLTVATHEHESEPEIFIALNQQQDIKLAFYSNESLKGARITIQLPENVALVGYPGRRTLSWTTDLKKGENLLRLPVVATQIARGDLVANIEFQDRVKTLTIGLAVNAADTSSTPAAGGDKPEAFVG